MEFVRLLFCHTCQSVDEIPDFDGPAQYDHLLEFRTRQHAFADGRPHRGILGRAENKRSAISAAIDQMANMVVPGSGTGLGQQMYDLRDNYRAEAMQCWKAHNRTSDCDEYRSDPKRLWIDTRAERKAEGLTTNRDERPNVWLCDHCPVHSVVQQRQRKAAGLYDT